MYYSLRQKVKGQSTCNFLVALPFWKNILISLHHRYFFLCSKMQDDALKTLRMLQIKKAFVKVNRYAFSMNVMFSSFCVYCARVSVSWSRFVIKVWWGFFRMLRTFSLHYNHYLASIVLKIWDIVQDVQTIQSDQPEALIWQTHPKTTYITFTICKKNMLFNFIKW